jgi:hypothetical protein
MYPGALKPLKVIHHQSLNRFERYMTKKSATRIKGRIDLVFINMYSYLP